MRGFITLLTVTLTLTACGSNTDIVRDCCYQGTPTAARINTLSFTLEDGSVVPVVSVLPGLQARPAPGGARYPVREVELKMVVEDELWRLFRAYDVNGSTHVEQPELTVLYLREAARGLGVPVAHVGTGQAVGALDTSAADIMGLVYFVSENRPRMNRTGQRVFAEMDSQRDWKRAMDSSGTDRPLVP